MTMTIVYDPLEVIYPGARPGIVGIAFNGKSLCRFSHDDDDDDDDDDHDHDDFEDDDHDDENEDDYLMNRFFME